MKNILIVALIGLSLPGCQTLEEVRSAGQNRCGQWVGLLGNKNSCYSESEMQTMRALRRMENKIDKMERDRAWDKIQDGIQSPSSRPQTEFCTNGRVMTAYGCRYR